MMKRLVLPSLVIMAAAVCGYWLGIPTSPKRVVGSPGDRIEIRSGVVLMNGKRLAEPDSPPR
jgi:hypothetical protein